MELPIYLDNAATTPVRPEVLAAMLPFFTDVFANASAIHAAGQQAREALEHAREQVGDAIGASPEEIYFTSGGTESDNWAVKGMADMAPADRRHVLCSAIEHHAVLEPCIGLRRRGWDAELIPVDGAGRVDPGEVARRIRPSTWLVSVMYANNEVGTVQDIAAIGSVCRERGVAFHTDAVQALGKIPIDVRECGVDLLSVSAHKLYGPKGVGVLFVRRGVRIASYQEGGSQEYGQRAGTLNVPGAVGLGEAVQLARSEMAAESARLRSLRDRLIAGVLAATPGATVTAADADRLPGHAHIRFEGIDAEPLLLGLDAAGVYASAGSACSAGSSEPSHVLTAMGVGRAEARGALRLTLGRTTTQEQIDYAVARVGETVASVRRVAAPAR